MCQRFIWPCVHAAASAGCVQHLFSLLPWKRDLKAQAMAFSALTPSRHKELPCPWLPAGSLKMSAYLSSWMGCGEKSPSFCPKDWSYLHPVRISCILPRPSKWSCGMWGSAQHREHCCSEHIHGGKFPVHSQESSEKLCCKRLLFERCSISCQTVWTWTKQFWKHIYAGMWGRLESKQHTCPQGELSPRVPVSDPSAVFLWEAYTAERMVRDSSSLQHLGQAWFCVRTAEFLLLKKEKGKKVRQSSQPLPVLFAREWETSVGLRESLTAPAKVAGLKDTEPWCTGRLQECSKTTLLVLGEPEYLVHERQSSAHTYKAVSRFVSGILHSSSLMLTQHKDVSNWSPKSCFFIFYVFIIVFFFIAIQGEIIPRCLTAKFLTSWSSCLVFRILFSSLDNVLPIIWLVSVLLGILNPSLSYKDLAAPSLAVQSVKPLLLGESRKQPPFLMTLSTNRDFIYDCLFLVVHKAQARIVLLVWDVYFDIVSSSTAQAKIKSIWRAGRQIPPTNCMPSPMNRWVTAFSKEIPSPITLTIRVKLHLRSPSVLASYFQVRACSCCAWCLSCEWCLSSLCWWQVPWLQPSYLAVFCAQGFIPQTSAQGHSAFLLSPILHVSL